MIDSCARSFRRTRVDHLLAQPKQFDLAVVLVKPSQRIMISVSCELLGDSRLLQVVASPLMSPFGSRIRSQARRQAREQGFGLPDPE